MAHEFNLTTQKQEFLKERYLKEVLTRVRWCRHYGYNNLPHLANTVDISTPKTKDQIKLPVVTVGTVHGGMDKKRLGTIHEHHQSPKDVNVRDGGETSSMRPASPTTLNLLYSGTSKEEQGRYRYMKVRNHLKPEDKYRYPLISSWEYGWQMGDAANRDGSVYRRCHIVSDTFFRKNGIPCQPHPKDMAL